MMHSDAYTLCNLDSQTYSTLPTPYHHHHHNHNQQHYQTAAAPVASAYLHQNDANYFQHAADCFRGAGWASCGGGAASGHVVDSVSGGGGGDSCVKRSRGGGGFYDGSSTATAAMVLYGHHPGVVRPTGAAAFEFPFPGFCAAGAAADIASSNSGAGAGCGYAAAAAAAAFYGMDSGVNGGCGGALRSSRSVDYGVGGGGEAALFYSGYAADQPAQPAAHLTAASNGHHPSTLELCSAGGVGSEFAAAALCGGGGVSAGQLRTGQPHSPTAVTANDQHRVTGGTESGSTHGSSGATYKWMTVKRGAPKSSGQ